MIGLGLIGTSSTGKTTLAKAASARLGLRFISSQARCAYEQHGVSVNDKIPLSKRIEVQKTILEMAEKDYREFGEKFISDRTPMDFAAHLLAFAVDVSDEEAVVINEYVNKCYEVTNFYFSSLMLIQPVIQVVAEQGRPTNIAYLSHINAIMTGLICDPANKLTCAKHIMKAWITDLETRVKVVARVAKIENLKSDRELFATH